VENCISQLLESFNVKVSEHWCSWQKLGESLIKDATALWKSQVFDLRDTVDKFADTGVCYATTSGEVKTFEPPRRNNRSASGAIDLTFFSFDQHRHRLVGQTVAIRQDEAFQAVAEEQLLHDLDVFPTTDFASPNILQGWAGFDDFLQAARVDVVTP
jgi:hypothetical protein